MAHDDNDMGHYRLTIEPELDIDIICKLWLGLKDFEELWGILKDFWRILEGFAPPDRDT